jgi:hypothetical protein
MSSDNQTGRGRRRRSLIDRICDNMAPELESETVSSAPASTCTTTLLAKKEGLSTCTKSLEHVHADESASLFVSFRDSNLSTTATRDEASASQEELSSLDPFATDSKFTLGADGLITLSTLLSDDKDTALKTSFKRPWANQAA